jgi:hypothetical protein
MMRYTVIPYRYRIPCVKSSLRYISMLNISEFAVRLKFFDGLVIVAQRSIDLLCQIGKRVGTNGNDQIPFFLAEGKGLP